MNYLHSVHVFKEFIERTFCNYAKCKFVSLPKVCLLQSFKFQAECNETHLRSVLPASTIPLGGASGGATQQKFTFGLSAAAAAKDTQASASNTPKSSLFG